MNKSDKQFKEFRNTVFLCSLLCFLFCFFIQKNTSSTKKDPSSEKQIEFALNDNAVVSENNVVKVNKPMPFSLGTTECNRTTVKPSGNNEVFLFPDKDFDQIKILLRCRIYNQYFASGLHGVPFWSHFAFTQGKNI